MDEEIAKWILEFLIRKPIDERILNSILSTLPLPIDDYRLKKTILLRRIDSEISDGSVSEKLLDLLEIVEELDHRVGNTASDSLKEAYCAVAVDSTVRFLEENVEKNGKFFEAVQRVWRNRVCKMEGLLSEESKRWLGEFEAAVWDSDVCRKILMKNTRNEALKAVRVYLTEAWESMGPTFLELAAEKIGNDLDKLRRVNGGESGGDKAVGPSNHRHELVPFGEIRKGQAPVRRKHVATKSRLRRGAKISHDDQYNEDDESMNNVMNIPTPEVERVQKALKSSSMELHAIVRDPLPDALRIAQTLSSTMATENPTTANVVENPTPPETHAPRESTENNTKDKEKKDDLRDDSRGNEGWVLLKKDNLRRPSLMEPNGTSHTFEWDDSIENSTQGSPSRPRLPIRKVRKLSPLRKHEEVNFTKRRARKRWTPMEEDTLRSGVEKFGKGNWKLILQCYRDIFQERTEVDLKDKWRNMMRSAV